MPKLPGLPCRYPGCNKILESGKKGYCEEHKKRMKSDYDRKRLSSYDRGYNTRWKKYRKAFLSAHPLCVRCLENNKTTAATVVDHIVPHKGNQRLFWNKENHQALCKKCHDRKSASEDGGFGNNGKGI